MDLLARFDEIVTDVLDRLFHHGSTRDPEDALRVARRALLRHTRRWFEHDLAPNRLELHIDPESYVRWALVRRPLERELERWLNRCASDHGLLTPEGTQVRLEPDEQVAPGRVKVAVAFSEGPPSSAFVGPLVAPSGWRFTGCRPLRRIVLRETRADGTEREHVIVFASEVVIGGTGDEDLCLPGAARTERTVLSLGARLRVSRSRRRLGFLPETRAFELDDGDRLRVAGEYFGTVRLGGWNGRLTSVAILSDGWVLTLPPRPLRLRHGRP
jgi:hypothetical protein